MNMSKQAPFRMLITLLCLISIEVYGQKETKTFKETFNVVDDAILDINTSHCDIEFETWNQNEVVIEAIIEIEGATNEEAADYFKNNGFEILGNSTKVSIKTGSQNRWLINNSVSNLQSFPIEINEFPEMTPFAFDFDFEELQHMPVFPINPMTEFDHEAFEEKGETYLKEWQKQFSKEYDKEHLKKIEEWAKRMEKRQEKIAKRQKELSKKRQEQHERRAKLLNERHEKMAEARAKRQEAYTLRRNNLLERRNIKVHRDSSNFIVINGDSITRYINSGPSIFYGAKAGAHKNFKVKKTIKVKMPKSMRIKMDIRHGEVKLAENTKNINATLSHSSLWAATIDGDKTKINISYTPLNVQNWKYGQLFANYSDRVSLKKVHDLRLNTNSSEVIIDNLVGGAFIKNDFGQLQINSIDKNFKDLDISLQNADMNCALPKTAFTIYVNGTSSKLTTPASITLNRTKNGSNVIHKGFQTNAAATKSIVINSKYSEVTLQ